jgi:hypothetical protein
MKKALLVVLFASAIMSGCNKHITPPEEDHGKGFTPPEIGEHTLPPPDSSFIEPGDCYYYNEATQNFEWCPCPE